MKDIWHLTSKQIPRKFYNVSSQIGDNYTNDISLSKHKQKKYSL